MAFDSIPCICEGRNPQCCYCGGFGFVGKKITKLRSDAIKQIVPSIQKIEFKNNFISLESRKKHVKPKEAIKLNFFEYSNSSLPLVWQRFANSKFTDMTPIARHVNNLWIIFVRNSGDFKCPNKRIEIHEKFLPQLDSWAKTARSSQILEYRAAVRDHIKELFEEANLKYQNYVVSINKLSDKSISDEIN